MAVQSLTRPTSPARTGSPVYSALVGLSAVLVLLQGLWAGLFLKGEDRESGPWLEIHARGGDLAIVLAAAAAGYAFWKLRERRDLWLGAGALAVVLLLEAYIGGLIVDQSKDVLTAVHVPLAMALMALVVWLPLRARRT